MVFQEKDRVFIDILNGIIHASFNKRRLFMFQSKKLMKNLSSFVGRIIDTILYLRIVLIGIMNYNKSVDNIYLKGKITSMIRSPNFGI